MSPLVYSIGFPLNHKLNTPRGGSRSRCLPEVVDGDGGGGRANNKSRVREQKRLL